ncbi:helix-turn-helix domain-containing protein [Gluconobacter cerinus]|uniref:helix-turn-helix domain-containing protein n=1 Tax=Gluconobacter cerinus TaxID=38307 RepID=UPI001B8B6C0B|nr:helix-turn-helix transcriptional regulator [Gluconobacter cerinus]MBS0984277.1 helix-turn-helix transcriptional regulator [Gluconobacter cerinus]
MTQNDHAAEDALHCIGINVRNRRKNLGLTQVELAEMTGIGQRNISMIERGNVNLTIKQMQRIASALKIDLKLLLDSTF